MTELQSLLWDSVYYAILLGDFTQKERDWINNAILDDFRIDFHYIFSIYNARTGKRYSFHQLCEIANNHLKHTHQINFIKRGNIFIGYITKR